MRRSLLLALVVAVPLGASLAAFACSSSDGARPADVGDGAPSADAAPGADASGEAAPPPPHCAAVDIAPGTGKKFCDLPGPEAAGLTVPAGFCVREFTTTPVLEARVLRFAPNGDLFVAAPSMATIGGASGGPGAIIVLPDDDADGRADAVLDYAGPSTVTAGSTCAAVELDPTNVACVHGLAFAGSYLYFTRSDELRRFAHVPGQRTAPAASELVATLGGAGISDARWTHTLEARADGSVYVSRGRFDTDGCSDEDMTRGAVLSVHVEGPAPLPLVPEVVATGFRNPMYIRCSPGSCNECYASELSGESWDGVGGREKLALLTSGAQNWGYPCCVARGIPAPFWPRQSCDDVSVELVAIKLHDTPFGLDFDRGGFPEPYRHGLFVALHGVMTSFGGTGVVWLATDPGSLRPSAAPQTFVQGFGMPNGRATDVAFAPDGRLFIADDTTGKIYWVAPRTLAAPR